MEHGWTVDLTAALLERAFFPPWNPERDDDGTLASQDRPVQCWSARTVNRASII